MKIDRDRPDFQLLEHLASLFGRACKPRHEQHHGGRGLEPRCRGRELCGTAAATVGGPGEVLEEPAAGRGTRDPKALGALFDDENARGSRDFLASSKDLGFRSLQAAHQIFRFLEQPIHRNTQPEDASFRPFERRLGALRSPILVFYGPFQRSLHRLSASC